MNMPPGACLDPNGEDYIAGWKTRTEWQNLKARIAQGTAGWDEAFRDFYQRRLDTRYLNPITCIQERGAFEGEGFAIAALQCTLIEFLESTEQGTNYVYRNPGPHEYSKSQDVFVSFLTKRYPFAGSFNQVEAKSFYMGVRCGLLHEARTQSGWRIWASALQGQITDSGRKILDRDNFQAALLKYIEDYGVRLTKDPNLQAAFIRKFDAL